LDENFSVGRARAGRRLKGALRLKQRVRRLARPYARTEQGSPQ
jgi:hypothetical protein